MQIIDWSPEYSVNVKIMDDQHKEMIHFINQVFDDGKEAVSPIEFNEFFTHARLYFTNHFMTEEKYFDLFKYEGAASHKNEHSAFLADIDELKRIHELKEKNGLDKDNTDLLDLVHAIEDHLFNHILKFDKQYTRCFNEHGLY